MSDETIPEVEKCPKCGKILDLCRCSTVTIEHKGIPKGEGIEQVKEERDKYKNIVEVISIKQFDEDKQKLLDSIEDPKKKEYVENFIQDDPKKMDLVKLNTALLGEAFGYGNVKIESEDEDDGTEVLPASSKHHSEDIALRSQNPNATKFERVKAEIDREYATLMNPEATQEQKAIANHRISEMLGQAVRGWRMSGQITRLSVMKCPKCGQIMERENCATCGYEIPRNQK